MGEPITKVLDADGNVLHDCRATGCEVSWDGYNLATGERVKGASDPGEQWDAPRDGCAQLSE